MQCISAHLNPGHLSNSQYYSANTRRGCLTVCSQAILTFLEMRNPLQHYQGEVRILIWYALIFQKVVVICNIYERVWCLLMIL